MRRLKGFVTLLATVIALAASASTSRAVSPKYDFLTAEVQTARVSANNGMPRLLINDRPVPPLIFFYNIAIPNRLENLAPQVQYAATNGVHIYSFEYKIPWTGSYYAYFDNAMDQFIAQDPNATFLLRIKQEIYDQTGSLQFGVGQDNLFLDNTTEPISIGSDAYYEAYADALRAFVTHYENSPYATRIIGYHIGGGENLTEWFPRSYRSKGPDYSAANTNAFRTWLRQKYPTDAALTQAWGRSMAFDQATIPTPIPGRFPLHTSPAGSSVDLFYAQPGEQDWIDYSAYVSDITSQRILDLATVVKSASLGKKLVAVFYGYTSELPGSMNGHLRMDRLLDAPQIDILAAPNSYISESDRLAGGPAGAMSSLDSVAAHGKLWVNENDLRTWLAAASSLPDYGYNGSYPTANFAETYNVLLRDAGALVVHRAGTWWMDLNANGAFRHSDLWGVVSGFGMPLYDELYSAPTSYRPDVAVIVDPRSLLLEKNDYDLMLLGRANLRNAIAQAGASIGYYTLDDFSTGALPKCKVYLFANAFFLTGAQVELVRSRLSAEKATAIWQLAPGFLGESGPSAVRSSQLTGIGLSRSDGKGGSVGFGALQGMSWGWGTNPISPRLEIVDASADILGRYAVDNKVSAASKFTDGFQSIFVGDINLSTPVLRALVRQGGAHVWTEGGRSFTPTGDCSSLTGRTRAPLESHFPRESLLPRWGES